MDSQSESENLKIESGSYWIPTKKMSFSLNKLKSLLPGHRASGGRYDNRHSISLEPEVGFQLTLDPGPCRTNGAQVSDGASGESNKYSNGIPELNVHLIGARHLPSLFGLKTVQGYVIKVKVFPGSTRYESTIQTCTWPKFNENFKFPMGSETKSSIKRYTKEYSPNETLPKKLFEGQFLVFTVYALLELPAGQGFNRFSGVYRSLKEKSNSLIPKNKVASSSNDKKKESVPKTEETNAVLTASESKRNVGTVTCFLDPKIFKENTRTGQFYTDELWLPMKDLTATPVKSSNITTSAKGQIEIILEISDECPDNISTSEEKPAETDSKESLKRHWSLSKVSEVKKKITSKTSKAPKELHLKVTTTRMRCPIKVKEEFESVAGEIYVKTTVFEHNILVNSWKCDMFRPSLSTRWDPSFSTIYVPLNNNSSSLDNVSIKTMVATKNKMGRKIVLGTVFIGAGTTGQSFDHWQTVMTVRNKSVPMWHSFQ